MASNVVRYTLSYAGRIKIMSDHNMWKVVEEIAAIASNNESITVFVRDSYLEDVVEVKILAIDVVEVREHGERVAQAGWPKDLYNGLQKRGITATRSINRGGT